MLNFDQFEEEFKTKAQPNFTTAKKTAKDDKDSQLLVAGSINK